MVCERRCFSRRAVRRAVIPRAIDAPRGQVRAVGREALDSPMPLADMNSQWAQQSFHLAQAAMAQFVREKTNFVKMSECASMIAARLQAGSKVLAIGNGGSMCDAMHFAEEFTGRFRKDRPPLPVIACSDPAHLTCVANDFGFDQVFARWVGALGQKGDVLVALSTSGNSPNIIEAVNIARLKGVIVVTLLGKDGGRLLRQCGEDGFEWIVGAESSDRIQEVHMLLLHTLIEGVERILYPELYESGPRGR